MFLKGCDCLLVNSREELENLIVTVASGKVMRADSTESKTEFRNRYHLGKTSSLFYLSSRFSSSFEFEPVDYLRFVFQLEHHVDVRVGSKEFRADAKGTAYMLPVGQEARETHPIGYRSLALRIDPGELQRTASRLLGNDVNTPIAFEQPDPTDRAFHDFIRGGVITAAREFGSIEAPFHAAYWETFEAQIAVRLLLHGRHNLSCLFHRKAPSGGRLERIEEHIRENWNKTLRLDDLAEVAGTSAKTVYSDFVRQYGETPHDFVKRLRLQNARDMLRQDPPPSTMLVALRCGFASFGHFARAYRTMFGELPSATARRPRR